VKYLRSSRPPRNNTGCSLHSPGFVNGLASGDVFELDESQTSGFRLVSRAHNLAVIVHVEQQEDKSSTQVRCLEQSLRAIGGTLDGGPERMLVFTVPVSAGLHAVETMLAAFVQELPGATWWFGNVYEAGDPSRPLNWWK
jgi:uncharacterized protein DUF4265